MYQVMRMLSTQRTTSECKKITIHDRKGQWYQPSRPCFRNRSEKYIGISRFEVLLERDDGANNFTWKPRTLILIKPSASPISLLWKAMEKLLEVIFWFICVQRGLWDIFFLHDKTNGGVTCEQLERRKQVLDNSSEVGCIKYHHTQWLWKRRKISKYQIKKMNDNVYRTYYNASVVAWKHMAHTYILISL